MKGEFGRFESSTASNHAVAKISSKRFNSGASRVSFWMNSGGLPSA